MKLDQNEILSLLFLSTSFEKEINMKEINEFLDIYAKNGDHDDKYYFYMPMHDDFNLELFEENKENGNFKFTIFIFIRFTILKYNHTRYIISTK